MYQWGEAAQEHIERLFVTVRGIAREPFVASRIVTRQRAGRASGSLYPGETDGARPRVHAYDRADRAHDHLGVTDEWFELLE